MPKDYTFIEKSMIILRPSRMGVRSNDFPMAISVLLMVRTPPRSESEVYQKSK